jgi:putative chitinase
MITVDQLKAIVPTIRPANLQLYTDLLNVYMPKHDITTPARVAPFLANLAHESGSFNYTREIASGKAYEGRADLGNTQPGDGPQYRGRGLIQITGRGMYKWCSTALYGDLRLINSPELLEQAPAATESACWFWKVVKDLNAIADQSDSYTHVFKGKTYSRFEWICFKINGGVNGMAERKAFYERAKTVIL